MYFVAKCNSIYLPKYQKFRFWWEKTYFCPNSRTKSWKHWFYYSLMSIYLIFQELVTTHFITNICCVVRDTANPKVFGYVTTTESGKGRNMAHVFTTDTEVSTMFQIWKFLFFRIPKCLILKSSQNI